MSLEAILPDRELPSELADLARATRAFALDKLAPHARRIDEERTFRRESVDELAAAGLLAGPIGSEHGGAGWDAMQLVVAHEEIGAVCGNTRGFLAVHTGLVGHSIEAWGDDEQRARWLPALLRGETIGCFCLTEEHAGSDIAS